MEAASPSGGGGTGGDRVSNHSLWDTPLPGHLLQVYWESSISGRQQIAGGGYQTLKSITEVGVDD